MEKIALFLACALVGCQSGVLSGSAIGDKSESPSDVGHVDGEALQDGGDARSLGAGRDHRANSSDDLGGSRDDGVDPAADSSGETRVDAGASPAEPDAMVDDMAPTGGQRLSFFAVGDTRSDLDVAQQTFQSMARLDPSAFAVFNSGDITLDGKASQWQAHKNAVDLGSAGKIRMDWSRLGGSTTAYFGVVGNHDVRSGDWLDNWNNNLSGQRQLGHNGADGVWFSVRQGNALFIVLDSEHSVSAQTGWLERALRQAAADPSIRWKFAFYHKPVYPCNYYGPWGNGIAWVRLFEQYGVDMVFNGHAHVYERSCPMIGGKCQGGGVRYVISGGGGAETGRIDLSRKLTSGSDRYVCGEINEAAKGYWHHYCHLVIDGGELTYRCYAHNATSAPEDTLRITK